MKIVFSRVKATDTCNFTTELKGIIISIPNNSGPELSFDDGYTIVFRNDRQHFRIMTDNEIYNNEEFNLEVFKEKYFKDSDRCYNNYGNRCINVIEEYEILGEPVYRFI